jgi:cytochrome P450
MNRPAHVPDHLVVDYDAFGLDSIDEMLRHADSWREIGPVLWTDRNGGHWLVISHEANREVLTNPTIFHNSEGTAVTPKGDRPPMVPLELDGEEHQIYRKVLTPLFAPVRVRSVQDDARALARSLLDTMCQQHQFDVVAEFARPLASSLFLSLVDWPLDDRHLLEDMVERELNAPGATADEIRAVKAQALADIAAYCAEQVQRRRDAPSDDMTTTLMQTLVAGEPIPDVRLVSMLLLLMIAGLDTTQSVLSNAISQLAKDRTLQARFRDDPAAIPQLVEELIRYAGPAGPNRAATESTMLMGVRIERGDRVHCMLQAANRDPAEFEDPNTVVLDRNVNRHLTFGVGPHKCIGAALARIVLAVALEEFHRRLPEYELVEASSHLGGVWGMNRVVVRTLATTATG